MNLKQQVAFRNQLLNLESRLKKIETDMAAALESLSLRLKELEGSKAWQRKSRTSNLQSS